MSDLPQLTELVIRGWTDAVAFERGERYFYRGAIRNPRRTDRTLKAECQGARARPYRVQVVLGPEEIVSGACSCSAKGSGRCKHAVALLLTWLNNPDVFVQVEDLGASLERRSKSDLIALIYKMLERRPDLEILLELPAPTGVEAEGRLDARIIQRQVAHAFSGDVYYEWGGAADIAGELDDVIGLGDRYAQCEQWLNAAVVYQTVVNAMLPQYMTVRDEGNDLQAIVNRCVEGLGRCLTALTDPDRRRDLLRTLFDVYRWNVDHAELGLGDLAPSLILAQATPDERQTVAQWVWAALPKGESWGGNYHRHRYGGFLLSLEEELDEDAFLRVCRETGRLQDLVEWLLKLNRVDQATAQVQAVQDYDLLQLADIFVKYGHSRVATRLVRDRLQAKPAAALAGPVDARLAAWLKKQAAEQGDETEALTQAETLFWQRPTLTGYDDVKALAHALGTWGTRRAQLLTRLAQSKQYALLAEIYLQEGEIDRAIEAVNLVRSVWWREGKESAGGRPLAIRVAEAAEQSRPRGSIRIYIDEVNRLIRAREPDSYATAVSYLARVRALYQRLGELGTWQRMIADIREQNRSLGAFQHELSRAEL